MLILLLAACATLCAAAAEPWWTLNKLDLNRYPMARCLDGSPGGFYVFPGTDNGETFVIHLQGGGWCTSIEDCANRAAFPVYSGEPSIGGSSNWGPGSCAGNLSHATAPCVSDGGSGGALSNNVTLNPLLAGATKVWASYCDGGGFSGHLEAPVVINATTTLYFRGAYILEAIVDTLLREYNLADAARVVLKGCSAGGMATYYSADPVAAQIAAAAAPAPGPALYAFPGAGFILDIPAYSGVNNIGPMIEWVFNAHNSSGAVSAACLSARAPGTEYLCMFPLFSLPYVRSPVFVANSIGDAAQLGVVMELPCNPSLGNCDASELAYFDAFRVLMIEGLAPVIGGGAGSPTTGAWLVECVMHMLSNVDRAWNGITVGGVTQADAFAAWYAGGGGAAAIAIDAAWTNGTGKPYGGNPECGSYGPLPSLPIGPDSARGHALR